MKHSFFWDLSALFVILNFAFAFVLDDPPPPSDVIQNEKYERDLPEKKHTWGRRDIGTFSNATANILFNYTVYIDNTPPGFGFNRETAVFKANTTGVIISLEIHYYKITPVDHPGCWSFDDFHVYPSGTDRNATNLLTNGGFDTGSYANATLVNGTIANATVINGTIAPWFNTYQNQTLNAKVGTKDEANAFVGPSFSQLTNYTGTAFAYDCPRSDLTDGIGQLIHTVPGQTYNLDFLLGDSAGPPRLHLMFFRVYATDVTGPLNLRLTAATDTGISQTDGITNLATPTLQGIWPGYSAGYQINIYINDTFFYGTATLGSDGTFNYPITQPLSNGTTNFTIRGNFSMYQDYELPMSSSFLVTYLQPPTVTLQLTNNPGNRNASSSTVVLNGVGVPNHLVSIYSNLQPGVVQTTATTDSTGAYTATLYFRPNGTRMYTAQQVGVGDAAGNPSVINSIPIPVTVYTQPTLSLSLSSNVTNNGATPPTVILSGSGQAYLPVLIYEGSTATLPLTIVTADISGAYVATLPNQLNGTHNYIALQLGACCNTLGLFINITSNLVPAIVYTPPALTLQLTSNTTNNNATPPTVLLTGTGSPNLPVSLYEGSVGTPPIFNTTTNSLGVYNVTLSNVSNGTHVYIAQEANVCCNGAGSAVTVNSPAQTAIVYIQPTITLRPADNQQNISSSSTVQLTGIGAANAIVKIYENFSNTTSLANATTDSTGAYSITLLNQSPGTHSYIAEQQNTCCTGGGSLITIDSRLVTLTIIPPSLTLTLPNNASSGTVNSSIVSLIGSGAPNLPVSVYDNTTGTLISVSNTTTNANGNYSVTFFNQTSGTHIYVSEQSVGGTLVKSQPATVTIPQVVLTLTLPDGSSVGTTNSSTVSLVGTGAPNLPVSVYENSTGTLISVYNATADINGVYTATILNQTAGTHIYVSQQSVGGTLIKSLPATVTVPQVILTLTLPDGSSVGTTNSSTVLLIGTGAPSLPVFIYANTTGILVSVYNTTADSNGVYTATTLNQSPGTNIYVSQQSVGGTLVYSLPVTVTIPQPIITLTLPDGTSTGISNSSIALLIGTGTPNLPVFVYDNSTGTLISVYNTTTNSSGGYSATIFKQTPGTHTYVSEQQVGSNLAKSQPAIVIIPVSPLTLTLPNGASAGVLNSTTISLIGTGAPNLPVTIYDNSTGTLVVVNNTITDGNGNYNATAYSQALGNHTYVSQQQVGSVLVTSQPVIITIPPSILTLTLPDGTQVATLNTTNVTLIGTGNPSLPVIIYDNTTGSPVIVSNVSANGAGSFSVTLQNQTSGIHVYIAQQMFGSTVISSLSVTITIILPTTPTLTLTLGSDSMNASISTAVYLTGNGTPNLPVSIFDSATGSLVSVGNTTTNSAGTYNATLLNQAPGTHTYVAQQVINGNVINSPPLVDTIIQPTLTLSLANGTSNYSTSTIVSLIGTGTAYLPVFVYENSTGILISVANTTANATGGYNVLLLNQNPGMHTYVSQQNVNGIIVNSQPVVDTIIQPSLTLSLGNGTSNYSTSTTVSLNGVGTANLPVFVFDNSTGTPISVFNGTTDGTGQYNDTLFNQVPGMHTYVSQQQVAGITVTSQPLNITIVQPTLTLSLANGTSNTSASTNVPLAGIGTPNLPVEIYDNSTGQLVLIANTTTNGAGSYNITLLNQAPGNHVYVSQQQIGVNLISSSPLTVVVPTQDTLTLTLLDGTDYGISYDPNITLTGKAPPNGMPVSIFDLNTQSIVGNTTVDSSGFFTISLPNQTSGTHDYIAVENDGASGQITSKAVLIEILTASLTLTLANAPYTNTSTNVSTSLSVPLTGTGVANQSVFIYSGKPGSNSTPIYNTTTDSLGNYNVVLPNQPNGTNIYTSEQALNGAGKQTTIYSNPQTVIVSKPTLTLTLPDGSLLGVSNSSDVYLIGVGTPNLLTYVYQNSTNGTLNLVGNATTDATGAYTVELFHQSDGSHAYIAEQTNAAGNPVIMSQQCVVIVRAPTLTLTLPNGSTSGVLNSSTVVLESVGTPNLPVYILTNSTNGTITIATVPANNLGTFTIIIPDQLSGTHVYTAEYRDSSGNPIADSGPVTVVISIPTITLTLPNGSTTGISNSSTVSLTGVGIPNLPVYILTNTTNGTTNFTLTVTNSAGVFNATLFNQQAGTNTYTAEQRDNSGKPITDSSPVTVVITLPTLTLTLPNGSSSGISSTPNVTLVGRGTPGFPVIIYENSTTGNPVQTFYPANDGTYNVTLVNEPSGNHTFIAEQRDNSGNLIADSQPCVVTVLPMQTLTLTLPDGSLSGTSNTTTLRLIGIGLANAPVEIYEATSFANASTTNGKLVANTTTNSAGFYNVTLINQNPGSGYYVASQQIPSVGGGFTSILSQVVTVTVPLPTLTLTLPNGAYKSTVNTSTVSLIGNGIAGYPISICDNSTGTLVSVANTTADSLGSYSVTLFNQSNGTHIYVAEEFVSDLGGNPITIISQPNVIITVNLPPTSVTPVLTLGLVGGGNISTTVDVSLTGQGTPYLPVYIYQDSPFTAPLGKVYADATGAYNLTLYNQTEGTHNYESAQQVPDFSGTPQIITSPIISVVVRPIGTSTYSSTLGLSTGLSSSTSSTSFNSTLFSPTVSMTSSGASSGIPSNSANTSVPNTGAPSISSSYNESIASTIVTSSASVSYNANASAITTGTPSFSPSNSASNSTITNTASPTSLDNTSNSSETSTSTTNISPSGSVNSSSITTGSLSASISYSPPNSSVAETGTPSISTSYSANTSAIATENPSTSLSYGATESSITETGTRSASSSNSANTSAIVTGSPSISPSFDISDSSALITSTSSILSSSSASNPSQSNSTSTTSGSAFYSTSGLSSVIITSSLSISSSYSSPDSSVVTTSTPSSTLSNSANSSVIETSPPSGSPSYSATNSSTIVTTASPSISPPSSALSSSEISITSAASVSLSYSASNISEFYTTSTITSSSSYSGASNNQGAQTGPTSATGSNSTTIYTGTVSTSQSYSENISVVITGSPSISTSYGASNYSEVSSTAYSSNGTPSVSWSYIVSSSSIIISSSSASISYYASRSSVEITTSTTSASPSSTANTSYAVTGTSTTTLSNNVYNSSVEASTSVSSTSFYSVGFSSDLTLTTSVATSYSAANSSIGIITESPSVTSSYTTNTSEVFTNFTSAAPLSLSTSSLTSSSSFYSTASNVISSTNATQSLNSITSTGTTSTSLSYSASNISMKSTTAAPGGTPSYTASSSVIITLESSTAISSGIQSNSLPNSSTAMKNSVSNASSSLIVNSTPSTISYYSTNGNQVSPTNATQSMSSIITTGSSSISQSYSAVSTSSVIITESLSTPSSSATSSSSIVTTSPSISSSNNATDFSTVTAGTPSISSTYITSNSSVITTINSSSETPSESGSSSNFSTTSSSNGIPSSAFISTTVSLMSGTSTIGTSYTTFVVTTSTIYSSNSLSSASNSSSITLTSAPSDSTAYTTGNSSITSSTETISSLMSGTILYSSSTSILATTSAISSPSSSTEYTSYNTSNVFEYSPTSNVPFSTISSTSTISTTYSVISSKTLPSSVSGSSTTIISTIESISSTVSSFYIISNSSQILSTSTGLMTPTIVITETLSSPSSAIISTTLFSTSTQSMTASETISSSIFNFSQILPTTTGSTASPIIITDTFSSTETSSATTAISTVSPSTTIALTIYFTNSPVTSIYSSGISASSPATFVYPSTNLPSNSGTVETTYGSAMNTSTISLSTSPTESTLVPTSNINSNPTSRYSTATGRQGPTGTETGTGTIINSATNSSQDVTTSTESISPSSSYFVTTSTYSITSGSGTATYTTMTSVYVTSNLSSTESPSETSTISISSPFISSSSSSIVLSSNSGPSGNSLTTSSATSSVLPSETTIFNTITTSSVTSHTMSSITTRTGGTVMTKNTSAYSSQFTISTSLIVPLNSTEASSLESTYYSSTEVSPSFALSTLTASTSSTSIPSTISSLTSISSYMETSSTYSTSNASTTTKYQSSSGVLRVSTPLTSTSEATTSPVYPTTSPLVLSSAGSLSTPTKTSSTLLSSSLTTFTHASITSSTGLSSSSSSAAISGSGSSLLHESVASSSSLTSTTYSESTRTPNTANDTTTGESTSSSLNTASTTKPDSTESVINTGGYTFSLSGTVSTTGSGSTNSVTSTGKSTSSFSGTASTTIPGPTNPYPTVILSTSMVTESISTRALSSSAFIDSTTTISGNGSVSTLNSYISVPESSLTVTASVSESTISSSTSESSSISSITMTRSVYSKPSKDSSHVQTHHPTGTETATTNTSPSPYNILSTSSSTIIDNSTISSSTSTIMAFVSGSETISSNTGSGSLTSVSSSSTNYPMIATNSAEATKASSGSSVTTTTSSSTETLNSVSDTTRSVAHSNTVTGRKSATYTETVSSTISGILEISSGQEFASATSSTSSFATASTARTSFMDTTTAGPVPYISTITSATQSYTPCLVYSTTSYTSDYGYVTSTYIAYTTTCLVSPTKSELTSSTSMPSTTLTTYPSDSTVTTETISVPTITKVTSAVTIPATLLTTSTIQSITTYTSGSMIITETVVDYTTVCTLTSSEGYSVSSTSTTVGESPAPTHSTLSVVSGTELPQTTSSSHSLTTSTIYTTTVYTITSCAQTVTNCPDHIGSVTTEVISLTTTICPVTEEISAKPTKPYISTLTVYATTVETITSCAPEVTDCPAKKGSLTTNTYAVYTSITTVTPTLPESNTPELYLSTQAPPAPTASPYTREPTPTVLAEPYNTPPAPSVVQYTESAWSTTPSYNQTWSSNFTTYSEPIVGYISPSSISETASTSAASKTTSQSEFSKPTTTSPPVSKYTAGAAQNIGRVSVAILVCIITILL